MIFLTDGPADAERTFAFAHGAGSAMDAPFMNTVARGVGERGIRVARFEFPYMHGRREPVLTATWREVISELGGGRPLFIGGKSMGGRMASLVADEAGVEGLICLGYPFHPPGDRTKLRTRHLEALRTPTLILQGTRDIFGNVEEVGGYLLSPSIRVEWLTDGDHSFKPRASSGTTEKANLQKAIETVAAFILRMG